jgi:hypothetical protein
MKGLRWGIGKAEQVKILKDHWVPGFPIGSLSLLTHVLPDAKFSFLMDTSNLVWDSNKLSPFFHEYLGHSIAKHSIR